MMGNKHNNLITKLGRVGVLFGGDNSEREVSLLSGKSVYDALKEQNIDAVKIDTKSRLLEQIVENKIDRAFIVLHGRDGEDGVIQGFLSCLGIPFTGSDTASSALAMNKAHCKSVARGLHIDTADFEEVEKNFNYGLLDAEKTIKALSLPVFVKPIREGSSVGMSKPDSADELITAVKLAQEYDSVIIERFVEGKEYTVTILNDRPLPSVSMVTANRFYDYEAKYLSNETQYFCPSDLTDEDEKQLQAIALNIFNSIGCSGWGRVDFIRDEKTHLFMLLEVNTVPGMTNTSLVPKAAKAAGLSYQQLVLEILEGTLEEDSNELLSGEHCG